MKLNLACGHMIYPKAEGWVNLDMIDDPELGIDVVAKVPPLPFGDETFEHIHCSHFLEHVPAGEPIIHLMNECWRILTPGGTMHVEVPYWNSEEFVRDPTHVQPWNVDKFRYFSAEFAYLRYGIKVWSQVEAQRGGWIVTARLVK